MQTLPAKCQAYVMEFGGILLSDDWIEILLVEQYSHLIYLMHGRAKGRTWSIIAKFALTVPLTC